MHCVPEVYLNIIFPAMPPLTHGFFPPSLLTNTLYALPHKPINK